jgi:hypothetical protein
MWSDDLAAAVAVALFSAIILATSVILMGHGL